MTRLQRLLIALGIILALPACTRTVEVPMEVKVPVPVPCEPVQVPPAEYPTVSADASLWDMAVALLAGRQIAKAETERLRAANANPCPEQ